MPLDNKYGKVTLEKGTVGEDEPVFIFRAQDKLLPDLLQAYYVLCSDVKSPARHLEKILEGKQQIEKWQEENFTKIPSSDPVD